MSDQKPSTVLAIADVPGGGRLSLVRHGEDYEILLGPEQLMGSWDYRSEQALATLGLSGLRRGTSRVLIGGLGMGFTLAAARAMLSPQASIIVAELVPEVAAWALDPLSHIHGDSLSDPRVSLVIRDVHDIIAEQADGFDAILLDVDNGPDGLVSPANERLYSPWGLRAAFSALRPGGVLAIWSAFPDPAFCHRLWRTGYDVVEASLDSEEGHRDQDHVIWLATRPSS